MSLFKSRTFWAGVILMISVIALGTVVFRTLEGWTWVESFYMTTMTMTGAGAEGYVPQSDVGKIFTGILAIFSVGVIVGVIAIIFHPISEQILEVAKNGLS